MVAALANAIFSSEFVVFSVLLQFFANPQMVGTRIQSQITCRLREFQSRDLSVASGCDRFVARIALRLKIGRENCGLTSPR